MTPLSLVSEILIGVGILAYIAGMWWALAVPKGPSLSVRSVGPVLLVGSGIIAVLVGVGIAFYHAALLIQRIAH